MDKSFYTRITYNTLTGARDRVLDDLNLMTNGRADTAIKYVQEFLELDKILKEFEKENPQIKTGNIVDFN